MNICVSILREWAYVIFIVVECDVIIDNMKFELYFSFFLL